MSEQRSKINVCVVGLGNCATSLISSVAHYQKHQKLTGLNYETIGDYKVDDINFVLGFDVDKRKVGKSISEAIQQKPNCTPLLCSVDELMTSPNVTGKVYMGPVLDGCPKHMLDFPEERSFRLSNEHELDEGEIKVLLKANAVDVIVNYLPVGSQEAVEFWANMCLKTGISFMNCMPIFIASDPVWAQKFKDAGIPIIGDDIRSAVGSSILSAMLQSLLLSRGIKINNLYQLNTGGNTDFAIMSNKDRLKTKKISKENVIRNECKMQGVDDTKMGIYAGPSEYIPHLGDNKIAYININAENLGGQPVTIDLKLSVMDSPNSGSIVLDSIRFLMLARDLGMSGPVLPACAVYCKTPPVPMPYYEAKEACDELARTKVAPKLYEGLD
jgi:myo-inositol-1-phosphate synthase